MLLDALIRWSLHNRLTVAAAAAAFLVWGSYVAVRMPVDVLPGPDRADGDGAGRRATGWRRPTWRRWSPSPSRRP